MIIWDERLAFTLYLVVETLALGSLHAEDPAEALEYARDVYTRRSEGVSIWVVKSSDIVASQEDDADEFFDPMDDKPYRHATHYRLPQEVDNM